MTSLAPAVVFDLDGTLIDSALDIRRAINLVLAEEGAAPLSPQETVARIGHGVPHFVTQARECRGLPDSRQASMLASMLTHYATDPVGLTRIYPLAIETLQALRADGVRIGLCTNKATLPTRAVLDQLGMNGLFDAVVCGDTLATRKPDPAMLTACFDQLGGRVTLYVGDSEVDAETAQRAGIPFAFFTQGYCHAPIDSLPHAHVFDHYSQLAAIIARELA